MYQFTTEVVFRGHPDKVCDQIADALVDEYLAHDPNARCAFEVLGGKKLIVVSGEVSSTHQPIALENVVYDVLRDIGYGSIANTQETPVLFNLTKQSPEIARGVDRDGAGDQGIMYGYACDDTPEGIPAAQAILQEIAYQYDRLRVVMSPYYKPDGKAQLTGIYDDDGKLKSITNITVAFCHRSNLNDRERNITYGEIYNLVYEACAKYGYDIDMDYNITINTAGAWTIGGFEADTGLTGRKIVCDQYGGFAPVGGGAFSGKDPTKMDRAGAYKAREIAMRILKVNPKAHKALVQLGYQIGVKYPISAAVKIDNRSWETLPEEFFMECVPSEIIKDLDLRRPIYQKTAQFGHFGHDFKWEQTL